ncbi:MAG: glycoside hydrolase family 3 N-terminal domain-containing protein [Cyclobacteriaceae bacterium]
MKRITFFNFSQQLILLLSVFFMACSTNASTEKDVYGNQVEEILSQMTLEEKVGQMMQLTIEAVTVPNSKEHQLDMDKLRKGIIDYGLGSILNTPQGEAQTKEYWYEMISKFQKMAIEETRLGIPLIYGVDAIHGVTYTDGATFFPQQLGQAATFNRSLIRKGAEVTAYETRASNIPWNFSPVLDMGRDPRWPRIWETFGEDVYLARELGREMVIGYEGDDISDSTKVAACAKHFLGYSIPWSGKDRTPAYIPERQLREYFLPTFESAIEAGVHTFMVNSGEINGIPVHGNHYLLTEVLKEELGFKGLVVTDWEDIVYLHTRHKIASTPKEAVKIAINAGIDMSMVPYNFDFADYLIALVNEGEVPMSRINDAVRRILWVKVKLGLFEKPNTHPDDYPLFGGEEFAKAAYTTAAESITLLKNEGSLLPLSKNAKVLVTGPNANLMRALNGGWSYSWQGHLADKYATEHNTIVEAMQAIAGQQNVKFVEGVSYLLDKNWDMDEAVNINEAVSAARNSDYIVLCLGENSYCEKPGDLEDLYLSANQELLAKELAKTGKPIILVLTQGRPRIISKIEKLAKSIVYAYLPGNYGGDALASILYGDENPSGRLPITYPRYPNSLVTYDHKYTEALSNDGSLYKSNFAPQFEFGHGLSYTQFSYSDLQLSKSSIGSNDALEISVQVKNTGDRMGKEAVLMYVSDLYASITPSVKRLRGFEKIELKAGETKQVKFTLNPAELAFVGHDLKWIAEAGAFTVAIADLQADFSLSETIVMKK